MSHILLNEKVVEPTNKIHLFDHNSFIQGASKVPMVLKEDARPSISIGWGRVYANVTHAVYHFVFDNPVVVNWAKINLQSARTVRKTSAPLWLHKRMEALRQMPQPTLKESLSQWHALGEARKKLGNNREV